MQDLLQILINCDVPEELNHKLKNSNYLWNLNRAVLRASYIIITQI